MKQEPHDLSRDSIVTKQGQVLPDGAANAPADQQEQELARRQAERPQRQHLIRHLSDASARCASWEELYAW